MQQPEHTPKFYPHLLLIRRQTTHGYFFTAFVFLRHQQGKDAGETVSGSFSVDFPWIALWHIINEAENKSDRAPPYFRPLLTRKLRTNIYLNRLHYMFHLNTLNRLKVPLLYNKINHNVVQNSLLT